MGWKLVRQPNNLIARWSDVVDAYTHWNLTIDQARDGMRNGELDSFHWPVSFEDCDAILAAVAELPLAEWWHGVQWMLGNHHIPEVLTLVHATTPDGELRPALVSINTEGDWHDDERTARAKTYHATVVQIDDGEPRRYATGDPLADIRTALAALPPDAVIGIGGHLDSLVHETLAHLCVQMERAGRDERGWQLVEGVLHR